MKNVTPATGQVWSNNATEMPYLLDEANIGYTDPVNLHKHFTFQPQNDLEWLAVNEPDWFHPLCNWIRRDDNSRPMYTSDPHHPLIKMYTYYTREQWQNMRYDLGLDEETGAIRIMNATIKFRRTMTPLETLHKETKMIDLSTAKVGDEFVLNNGYIVSLFARTKMNSICQLQSGHVMLYTHDGKIDEMVNPGDDGENWRIMAKHDSRTDEEKAIDDLIKPALIFTAGSGSYQKDAEKFLNVIKAGKIHGVKWVGE